MTQAPYWTDGWWVSEYNFIDETRAGVNLAPTIGLHDCTLRDGEQTPGVVLRKDEKVEIARMLDEVGVARIEAGMPAVSAEDAEAITAIAKLGLRAKIIVFCRAAATDIDRAVDCGADGVIIEVPAGYPKLEYQFKWSEDQVIGKSVEALAYGREKGLELIFFPHDTTRAKLSFLRRLLGEVMRQSPPHSVTVVDTTGSARPAAVKYLVEQVRDMVSVPVEVHTHDDFGLGVATTLAGAEGGANMLHVCVNGLGERTGNAALDEVAASLQVLYGVDLGIKMDRLYELSLLAERCSGVPLPANKPLVGAGCFRREIGLFMDVLERTPLAILPIAPSVLGRHHEIVVGKKSGKASIRIKLDQAGIPATDVQADAILADVKDAAIAKKGLLSDEEFLAIARSRTHA
ncbi:MAG: 3-hydroxy-3-methylglutaryl-CoA lyase [Acidobacteriota bacterium]